MDNIIILSCSAHMEYTLILIISSANDCSICTRGNLECTLGDYSIEIEGVRGMGVLLHFSC